MNKDIVIKDTTLFKKVMLLNFEVKLHDIQLFKEIVLGDIIK